ncbi:GDP-mannose 4,6-dehydratase [methanotrophic endosymbiont of Bathymodiolus puteoserpentis (Logatchev)]|jgi:nucleoside-diphosphate-sugar epimerase|uniref:GDP-mannose 4,6-dehydratase n=1 Tax=methanotrophic endosymbiont of Bathymodiolus puteoserpentis (Logatchev) TaxID=343235 RepID=UPI0013CC1328|nr:GDP-mannose 4,6-dehydratase [methanotrophic endosymbiont of Bathymodiolus puteoserpentis (Logatchev)]SHE23497.1 UDP-glucose 4-epimerase [methanotrophic endosymbiont of Bathymodiolus puteoserpentis (Logatchev)]
MTNIKRALITGLNGFTGQYLASELSDAGYAVYGTGAGTSNLPRYFQVDLLDKQGLANVVREVQPSVVVHLAAIAFIGHGTADDFYQVNLIGTRNLLEALTLHEKGLDAVLLASSANIYGNSTEGILAENTLPNPANDYAVSKLAMEYMAKLWMDKLPIFIVRPFNYTGVGQTENFLLPKIVAHFRRRAPHIELGNLDVWRDFSDVRVVAQLYRQLLEVKPLGLTVNICSGKTHSLRDVLAMAETISGHKMEVRINSAFVRANEVKTLCGDTARLRSLVGEWDMPSLEETLRWMLSVKA